MHLKYSLSPYDVKVELGRFDICNSDVTSSMLSVMHIQLHPEYQYLSRANDLALLRLNTFAPYHNRVLPICLPTPGKCSEFNKILLLAILKTITTNIAKSKKISVQERLELVLNY